jgi:hypothetical protein
MHTHIRTLGMLTIALALAAGCSTTSKSQRVSQAPSPPPTITTAPPPTPPPAGVPPPPAGPTPIPGHPPVTVSGMVAGLDPATGVLTLQDGRTVRLTDRSKILQPADPRAVQPGDLVVVRDALPIGVRAVSSGPGTGKGQRMATVASVDQANQVVRLTDGSSLRVTLATNLHVGTGGEVLLLSDLRSGDELVIVVADEVPMASGALGGGTTDAMSGRDVPGSPSALPRQGVAAAVPTAPAVASELMVFRNLAP